MAERMVNNNLPDLIEASSVAKDNHIARLEPCLSMDKTGNLIRCPKLDLSNPLNFCKHEDGLMNYRELVYCPWKQTPLKIVTEEISRGVILEQEPIKAICSDCS